jgi:hypothetical protein
MSTYKTLGERWCMIKGTRYPSREFIVMNTEVGWLILCKVLMDMDSGETIHKPILISQVPEVNI